MQQTPTTAARRLHSGSGGVSIGPYGLICPLNGAADAPPAVFEAVDGRSGRVVRLATVAGTHLSKPQLEQWLAGLNRDRQRLTLLGDTSLVRIRDAGVAPGVAGPQGFVVTDALDGETLAARLERDGPLSLPEASAILRSLANALDALHGAQIVHGNVRPESVLLPRTGKALLTDFGFLPLLPVPPQTSLSDIQSLAALFHGMLGGTPHDAPERLLEVLERAFDANPARRFLSASALADAVEDAVEEGLRIRVFPVSGWSGGQVARSADSLLGAEQSRPGDVPSAPPPAAPTSEPHPARRGGRKGFVLTLPLVTIASAGLLFLGVVLTDAALRREGPANTDVALPPAPAAVGVTTPPTPPPGPGEETVPEADAEASATQGVSAVPTPRPSSAVVSRMEVTEKQPQARVPSSPAAVTASPRPPASKRVAAAAPAKPVRRRPAPRPTPIVIRIHGSGDAPAARPDAEKRPPRSSASAPRDTDEVETENFSAAPAEAVGFKGVWRGTHSGNPALLEVREENAEGDRFTGILTVRTPEATVRVEVRGRLDDAGDEPRILLEEKRILETTADHAWDLGSNTGYLNGADVMSGTGQDRQGRRYTWRLQRAS